MIKLLIIEDDNLLAYILKTSFEFDGEYSVSAVANGWQGIYAFLACPFDIVVVNAGIPDMPPEGIARRLRQAKPNIPILFMLPECMHATHLATWDTHTIHCIYKPFLVNELDHFVKDLVSREPAYPPVQESPKDFYQMGRFLFYPSSYRLQYNGIQYELTERESSVLQMLVENSNQPVAKEEILLRHWNKSNYYSSRSLTGVILRLRRYLALDPTVRIQTIKKQYYCLVSN